MPPSMPPCIPPCVCMTVYCTYGTARREDGHLEVPLHLGSREPLFPFHCWSIIRHPVVNVVNVRKVGSWAHSPLSLYPFHCWRTVLSPVFNLRNVRNVENQAGIAQGASYYSPVSLLVSNSRSVLSERFLLKTPLNPYGPAPSRFPVSLLGKKRCAQPTTRF